VGRRCLLVAETVARPARRERSRLQQQRLPCLAWRASAFALPGHSRARSSWALDPPCNPKPLQPRGEELDAAKAGLEAHVAELQTSSARLHDQLAAKEATIRELRTGAACLETLHQKRVRLPHGRLPRGPKDGWHLRPVAAPVDQRAV
jgi:hypothetical protein